MFPDSSQYKNNGSCMYLSEILNKLQMFKVTNFMTASDGLLIQYIKLYAIFLINHRIFPPGHNQ